MIIKEVMGIEYPLLVNQEGYKLEYSGDNQRLLSEIGGYSFRPFKETIEELVTYYQAHEQEIDANLL